MVKNIRNCIILTEGQKRTFDHRNKKSTVLDDGTLRYNWLWRNFNAFSDLEIKGKLFYFRTFWLLPDLN